MRQPESPRAVALLLAWLSCGACSFHSLDYLDYDAHSAGVTGNAASGKGGTDAPGGRGGFGSSGSAGTSTNAGTQSMSLAGAGATATNDAGAGPLPELPDCTDKLTTADETDVDCGGRTCAPCEAKSKCITGTDCASAICTNQICQPPTCTDLAVNGDETDMNCGGVCPGCALGLHCQVDADCASRTCSDGLCATGGCTDGVLRADCPLLVDNTPYALMPGHALSSCIEDDKQSVAEGNAMLLRACEPSLPQTFWAVAAADGFFALRSALSGKCLQVRSASKTDGAVVEQSACDSQPEQLWMPSIIDSSLMQLTAKHSGLALDVAGADVATDGQAITQGTPGSLDTQWRLVKRPSTAHVTLSPYADPTLAVRHSGNSVTVANDQTASAQWKVVPGLSDINCVSFQARDSAGHFLRHAAFRLWTDNNDGSDQLRKDATFCYLQPLQGNALLNHALQSVNYPGRRLSRSGDLVTLDPVADTAAYAAAATWQLDAR